MDGRVKPTHDGRGEEEGAGEEGKDEEGESVNHLVMAGLDPATHPARVGAPS